MDSVLSWVGGKSQSAKKIVSLMPVHGCYTELFFGAGWIFFCKEPSKDEIINDINSELMNFYKVIQRECDKFKEREKYEMYSRELYYEYLQDFYSGKHANMDNVERAFRFFYLIKAAFASKFSAGFAFGSNRQSSVAFFNQFKELDGITKRLKNATIDNRDFEDIIKSYDSDRTLFMCDPPYLKSDNTDYYFKSANSSFTLHDQQRLFMALRNIKGKFILTIDDTEWVRERYFGSPESIEKISEELYHSKETGFYWLMNEVYYCSADADNRRHEVELIICNYNPKEIKKHIDKSQGRLEF